MQNFDDYNERLAVTHITRFCGDFSIDLAVRILDTINHALAIGLGFLTSAYVQNDLNDDETSSLLSMFIMAALSVLVSYAIEYVRFHSSSRSRYKPTSTVEN